MKWDDEVDVVCTDSGAGGLASAISVVDLGGEVFVANSSGVNVASEIRVAARPRVDCLRPWLGVDVVDAQTSEYLAAVASDLGPLRRNAWEVEVPIRAVHEPAPVESRSTVAPFVGSRLREWAARCLASPYGWMYTRVSNWQSTTMQTSDGDVIEVAEIGSMAPDPDDVGGSVLDWLIAQTHDRRIELIPNSSLQRIVFEEGDAVGAVFTTPDGTLSIRARHGVIVANSGPQAHMSAPCPLPGGDVTLRVCLVGQHASRFGRVELLTSEALARGVPSTCGPVNRALHVNLHGTQGHLPTRRCGKVHGYPPFGQ